MPTVAENTIKTQIKNVIRRFKFEEVESAILPVFPETSWDYVRTQLIKRHQNFTTANVATLIDEVLNEENLGEKKLIQRLIRLELFDISRHKRKVWYTYSLSGSSSVSNHVGSIAFKKTVREQLSPLMRKQFEIDTLIFNGIMYISFKNVQKNHIRSMANHFALFLGQKYLFSAKKDGPKIFLDTIIHSIGYAKCKSIDLHGKDLLSLIKLLRMRKQGVSNTANIINELIDQDAEPTIKSTGVDFTQEKRKKEDAEKCFGESPPILDILVVKGPNCAISDREIRSKLSDDIQIGWEFRSRNIATFLTTLVERGILLSPLPPYIANLMSMGKNVLTLQEEE